MSTPARFRASRGRLHACVLATASLCALARPAGAQLVSAVDAGASSVRYDGISSTAMSLTPSLMYERGAASLFALGSLARYETGEIGTNGALSASILSAPVQALLGIRGELAMDGTWSTLEGASGTGQLALRGRAHLTRGFSGLWLGAGAGRGEAADASTTISTIEAGGWWRHRALLVSGSIVPSRAGDARWTDVASTARWTRGVLEVGGTLGARVGGDAVDAGAWGGVDGVLWLTRHIALSASAGSYRADLAQGVPGGRYVTVGVRLASRPPLLELARARRALPAAELVRPVAGRITVRGGGDRRTIRIDAPGAQRVEIMGDFTAWEALPLVAQRGSTWEITLPMTAGSHRFNVRVNGGDWGVPDGVTAITDDFGGVAGILIVR